MSLRTRLLIAIGVIAVVALAIADVVTYSALQSFLYQRIDQQLEQFHGRFEGMVDRGTLITRSACSGPFSPHFGASGPSGSGGVGLGQGQPPGQPSNAIQAFAVEVRSLSGGVVDAQSCPAYVSGTAYVPQIAAPIAGLSAGLSSTSAVYFDAPAVQADGPSFRVRASVLPDGQVLIVAEPLGDIGSTLHHLLLVELAVTGAAVVVALIGGLWLVRLGLRPLRDMELTAESIAAGNLTERVPGENDTTEVGRLARTLNLMLSRIEFAFSARLASEHRLRASEQQLRRFVADASHELRTPIAAISAYAELFGRGASEQKEDLERLMGGIRHETTRMEHLVADLLLLARLDEGRPMEQKSVDLVALCAEAVQTAVTVGPQWPITFEASRPIEVMGDATSLRQVVDNLLANVRAHTPPGTTARVRVEGDDAGAVITVADDGPGMVPEEAEHVFERFYRSDPSRSRTHGGAGLGLSIVGAIVAAHGGTVAARGAPGAGATFIVHLPTTPADPIPPPRPSGPADGSASVAGAAGGHPVRPAGSVPSSVAASPVGGPVSDESASSEGPVAQSDGDGARAPRRRAHSHEPHSQLSSPFQLDPPQSPA